MSNEKTKADFDKKMDTNVDFKDEDFKYYASKGDKFVEKIKKKGAVGIDKSDCIFIFQMILLLFYFCQRMLSNQIYILCTDHGATRAPSQSIY